MVYIITTAKLKSAKIFLLAYIRMVIPYRTAKFKSANILAIAILGSTAKFNSRQYFRLYGIIMTQAIIPAHVYTYLNSRHVLETPR